MNRGVFYMIVRFCAALLAVAILASTVLGGEPFPDIELNGQQPSVYQTYLETEDTPLHLSDIPSPYVLIYVFNVYCDACDKDMPNANKVFEILDGQGLSNRIKMIGIGLNNSLFEVNFFRNKFSAPMPVFPYSEAGTRITHGKDDYPVCMLIRNNRESSPETVLYHDGPVENAEEFAANVLRSAGYGN